MSRRADPGPAQEQRTPDCPAEGGCGRREDSAERHHQSLSASPPAEKMHVPQQCSQAARNPKTDLVRSYF